MIRWAAAVSKQSGGFPRPLTGLRRRPDISSKQQLFVKFLSLHHVPDGLGQFAGQGLLGHRHVTPLLLAFIPGLNARVVADGAGRRLDNAAAGDFRIKSTSPCRNAGNWVYSRGNTDLAGNPRLLETNVDMGAYEYVWNEYVWIPGQPIPLNP